MYELFALERIKSEKFIKAAGAKSNNPKQSNRITTGSEDALIPVWKPAGSMI